jgi:hypothetical protein
MFSAERREPGMMGSMTLTATRPAPTMADVRAWAIEKGLPVHATGNVPNEIIAAYNRGRQPHRRFERAVASRAGIETR